MKIAKMSIFAQKCKLTINTNQLYAPQHAPKQARKHTPPNLPQSSNTYSRLEHNFVKACLQHREGFTHGGLYRWRENSFSFFFISETKRDFD